MRPHHPTREPRDRGAEDHPPKRLLLHGRKTQLRQQERRPAIRAPRVLEVLNADLLDGFDAALPQRQASVVEHDGGMAHRLHDFGVQFSRAVVGRQVGLESGGVYTFGLQRRDEVAGGGGGAVVVDGDGATEGGEGKACRVADPTRGTGYERQMGL